MKKPNYQNDSGIFLTADEARARYRVSRFILNQIAADAGAIVRIGQRIVRYDSEKLDMYLRGVK